jgi:Tol biopolymer transport system component/subtilase family serine protease
MNADGTGQTQLTFNTATDWHPAWSPDGSKIAFHSNGDGDDEIYVMNADGTGQTQLTFNTATDWFPAWSPDGSKIAFHSNGDGDDEIYVMNADGTGQTQLTFNSTLDRHPAWSPDGLQIAFRSNRDGDDEIYVMNADGTGQTNLTNNPAVDWLASWRPVYVEAEKIAFTSDRDGDNEIYVMNADGTDQIQLTFNTSLDRHPNWSPHRSLFVFSSDRDGDEEIYVMNADGSGQTQLTFNNSMDAIPDWSPDGLQIAFRSNRDGDDEIYVMNVDGSDQTQLTFNTASEIQPDWSPDGSKIAFTSGRDGNDEIYMMDADGSDQTNLTSNSARDFHPAWSPDGSKIAFSSDRDGNTEIYVMDADGTDPIQLTFNAAYAWHAAWSPDGTKITFISNHDGDGDEEIYMMNADGSGQTQLTFNTARDWLPSWSPGFVPVSPITLISSSPSSPNGANGWFITTPTITLSSDEPGTIYYRWDSSALPGDPGWITYLSPFGAPEGEHTLYYYSADTVGNPGTVNSQVIKVDTNVPWVDISSPSEGTTVSGSVSIDGIAYDANFLQYTIEYGAGKRPLDRYASAPFAGLAYGTWWRTIAVSNVPVSGGVLASWDTTVLDNSHHTLRLIARDNAGNTSFRLLRVRIGNSGRPYFEEVTTDPLDILPDISADGEKIAFTSDKLGTLDTWLMNADGTGLVAIPLPSDDRHPSLSPDGQQVVFTSDRGGSLDIWKMNIDGTGLTQLTNSASSENVSTWSHDGQKIVYASDINGNNDIFIMNPDGTSQANLTNDPADDWQPDISPDGTKIVFHSNRAGSYDIWMMNTDGTGLYRVTTDSSSEQHPSFSPDGQRIVFNSGKAGNADIWIMNMDGSNLQRLTDDPAPDAVPTWSPDGSRIVFASGRSGLCDIYSMNTDGSNLQRLTFSTDDSAADINYDSSQIAFTSNRARNYTPIGYEYRQGDIYLVNIDGTNLNLISDLSYYSHHPSFSPAGQSIAFTTDQSGNHDVWRMNIDGTGLIQLTNSSSRESVPTWSTNGQKIVYSSDISGNDDIFLMNQDGSSKTALTFSPFAERFADITQDGQKIAFSSDMYGPGDVFVMNSNGTGLLQVTIDLSVNEWHPSFNPSGNQLTFVRADVNTDIYMIDTDGTNLTRLTHDTALDTVNTWSPDGNTVVFSSSRTTGDGSRKTIWKMTFEAGKIAFTSDRDGDEEIYVMNTDGTGQTQLTFNTALDRHPAWSPDGSKIVFRSDRDGDNEIYVMNADGTGQTQLTFNTAVDWFPDWSPDGSKIVFISDRDGDEEIYVMNADGTGQTQLTFNTAIDWHPDWSPDGSKIVFSGDRDGDEEIYVMNADGTDQTQLTFNTAIDRFPAWSPDGSKIAFMSNRDGDNDIYVMNADGSGQTQLTFNTALDRFPDWSPDGSKIVFSGDRDGDDEIYVMNADGTDQTQLTFNTVLDWTPSWSLGFVPVPPTGSHTITASAGENGSISPSGAVIVNHNATQTFTVTPESGYLAVMSGTCGGNLESNTYTTNPVTVDCTVTATFNPTGSSQTLPSDNNVQVSVPVSLPSDETTPVTVTFDEITSEGTLSITATDTPPADPPTVFQLLDTYYNVAFTGGSYSGDIHVTFPYDESLVVGAEEDLRLFHYEDGAWVDVTVLPVDTVNNTITGQVNSLSLFVIAIPIQIAQNTDLIVSSLKVPATGEAGTNMNVKDVTKNKGSEPSASSATKFYLSTDTILDSSDTVLGSRAVPVLAAGVSNIATTSVAIPAGIAGKFYIIAKADAEDDNTEINEANNTKSTGKPVTVGPDLFVKSFTAPKTATAGVTISIGDKTMNKGPANTDASLTRFYLSTNFTLDDGDTEIGNRVVPELAAKESSEGTTTVPLPGDIAGIYYIIVKADADEDLVECNENNNTRFRKIRISGGPDLVVSSLSAPSSAEPGEEIYVEDTTTNDGNVTAGASTIKFYLSTNSTFNPGDILLESRSVPELGAGESSTDTTSVTIPDDIADGSYYLIARADANGPVAETDETNNTISAAITILP